VDLTETSTLDAAAHVGHILASSGGGEGDL